MLENMIDILIAVFTVSTFVLVAFGVLYAVGFVFGKMFFGEDDD